MQKIELKPQPWYQEKVLSCSADILISGASAGVGKTFAMLLEATRHASNPQFSSMIFRRTTPQIRNPGGLWDTSKEINLHLRARPKESELEWIFPSGSRMKMSHLEHENDKYNHQGAQYPLIMFDELTHFSKTQFLYLLSRNRSTCGVRPYVRATCNPDPDSWVADLVAPWIDQTTGFPIREKEWKLLYMVVDQEKFVFAETKEELIAACPHLFELIPEGMSPDDIIKSVTFISGKITENKKLLEADPSYIGNLLSQSEDERKRLLEGNWKVRTDGMELFPHAKVQDMFSLTLHEEKPAHYITADIARFGRDLAVVYCWRGFTIEHVEIMTKSRTTDITATIERLRAEYSVPKSGVLVDQDGVGGWVVDEGEYQGFSGGLPAMKDPSTEIKENYDNLKTQCAYRMAERVDRASVAVSPAVVVRVDGIPTDEVTLGNEPKSWRKLLSEDLRSFKRRDPDSDGKKKIQPKAQQKIQLNGRSPDSGDAFIMREFFELQPTQKNTEIFFF